MTLFFYFLKTVSSDLTFRNKTSLAVFKSILA